MFKLTIGTAINRQVVDYDLTKTPKQALEEYGIDYSTGAIHFEGRTISGADLNKTFAELGAAERASLIVVVKADAAM